MVFCGGDSSDEIGQKCSKLGEEPHTPFLSENLEERDHLEDVDVDGRILFRWILKK
jgi:hypothetical protein